MELLIEYYWARIIREILFYLLADTDIPSSEIQPFSTMMFIYAKCFSMNLASWSPSIKVCPLKSFWTSDRTKAGNFKLRQNGLQK